MLFKVGELARRAGITVRTLHHYEAIGLLLPSARSAAGYRLYCREDITRLHHIQVLSRMGMSLNEIRECLARQQLSLDKVIDVQLSMLDKQINQMTNLRQRLVVLQDSLRAGEEPCLSEWLTTLELMNMYDRYFTQDERAELPFAQPDNQREEEWQQLVSDVRRLMSEQTPPSAEVAQKVATHWMSLLERDTGANPDFLQRLNAMYQAEPEMQKKTGITPEMTDYITRAFGYSKLAIYRRYLNDEEYAFTAAHYFDRMLEWPPLVADMRQAVLEQTPPEAEKAQQLAGRWLALFSSFAGNSPVTQQKFRLAMEKEPALATGTWMTPEILQWLAQAIQHMMQRHTG